MSIHWTGGYKTNTPPEKEIYILFRISLKLPHNLHFACFILFLENLPHCVGNLAAGACFIILGVVLKPLLR